MATTIRSTLARKGTRHSQPSRTALSAMAMSANVPAPSRVPSWMPTNGQRGEEATTAARRDFGNQRGGAGLFSAGTQSLQDAQRHQENGAEHAGLFVRRQQADGEAGGPHQADGEDQDHLAAEPVADVAEDHPAEGPGREAHAVRGEGCDQGSVLAERLEEQRAEDQGRGQPVDVEVVVLQGGAHGAGKRCPSQLFRIDDGAVRFSERCISTSCHKHSLKNTPDPRWPGGIVSNPKESITMLNRVQHSDRLANE